MNVQVAQVPQFVKVGHVARVLGLDPATIRRAIGSGELPAVRVRGQYLIRRDVLDGLMKAASEAESARPKRAGKEEAQEDD